MSGIFLGIGLEYVDTIFQTIKIVISRNILLPE